MSTPNEEQHTPTPEEEAIYAGLLTVQSVSAIVQAYTDGKIADLETYNKLYEAAQKADVQVQKLARLLEPKTRTPEMSMEEIMDKEHEIYEQDNRKEDEDYG